ncbi:MAG: glutamate-5-semialdehyde dehydrogenase [Terriglobia bacterium]|jgi:glutamate-5-semialdehyde dehydrogenase
MSTAPASLSVSTLEKLESARRAAAEVGRLSTAQKNEILAAMALEINRHRDQILAANAADLAASDLSTSSRDRLLLTPARLTALVEALDAVRALPDPVGQVLAEWTRPNGLRIRKVRVPLGVVGIIYESRPNVTVDAVALCLKSGNAVVLRGGREAIATNEALVRILVGTPGVPGGAVELLDSRSRESASELMRARGLVDVLVPRGGASLINHVVEEATVPVIETGAGNCHVYVDKAANLDVADRIVINAKTQRPSVCNAAEKLLVHQDIAREYVPRIVEKLLAAKVELLGDEQTRSLAPGQNVGVAGEPDWHTEYLDLRMAIAVVPTLDAAIAHINHYSTRHSDAIVTTDEARAQRFLNQVDSAAVYWNASTRFTDGGEFGLGAEMGISNQKLHCRGPFSLPELTSTKFQIFGTGQIRN